MSPKAPFIPAAHFHCLTPWYEGLVRPFGRGIWKAMAREAAKRAPAKGHVVDLGCGPGTTLRTVRSLRWDLTLTGTDIDPTIIAIAKRKAKGLRIAFDVAPIDGVPLPSRSIDIALTSLVFHHLTSETKHAAFHEVRRILKPGGTFLLCDFSVPRSRRFTLIPTLFGLFEEGAIPQMKGELLELGKSVRAKEETLATFYGCISLHAFHFT